MAILTRQISNCFYQINVFLNRLNGEPIGISVFGVFVMDRNTILAVRIRYYTSCLVLPISEAISRAMKMIALTKDLAV